MNVKELYLKSRKSLLNWSILAVGMLVVLTFYLYIAKERRWADLINFSFLLISFAALIMNRFKANSKITLIGFFASLGCTFFNLTLLLLSMNLVKIVVQNSTSPALSALYMILTYLTIFLFLSAVNYLLYRVHIATKHIIQIKECN